MGFRQGDVIILAFAEIVGVELATEKVSDHSVTIWAIARSRASPYEAILATKEWSR